MRCPRRLRAMSTGGDTGELEPGCVDCQNYFFGECLGGDRPVYFYRLPSRALAVFQVDLSETIKKRGTVLVYAINLGEAQAIVDKDLDKWGKVWKSYEAVAEEESECDLESYVSELPDQPNGVDLVAYDGQVFDLDDFVDYIKERGFEDDEEVPLLAAEA